MKCPSCSTEVVKKSIYCHKCGERLDLSGEPKTPSAPPRSMVDTPRNSSRGEKDPAEQTANERLRDAINSTRNNNDAAEEELWEGGYCGKAMMGSWLLGFLATIGLLVLAVVIWSSAVLWWIVLAVVVLIWGYLFVVFARRRLGVHYRLTSERFFHEKGILVHTTDLIEVIDMDDITYSQTIIDRLFGVGTIRVVSSDRSHPDLAVPGIAGVKDVAAKMHEARHAERIRRGLHIESI